MRPQSRGDVLLSSEIDTIKVDEWCISVPIFKNPVILKQLGIVIGIPFGFLVLVIGLTSGKSVYTLYGLALIAALFFFAWLLIMVIYRGKYEVEFVLDGQGRDLPNAGKTGKENRIVNGLTVMLGLLTGSFAVSGAGMLAQPAQETSLRWNRVTKVKQKPKSRIILLRSGWLEQIALFCTQIITPCCRAIGSRKNKAFEKRLIK